MFWLPYFFGIGLCTCSAVSTVNTKETLTQSDLGTHGFDIVLKLTGKMESLSEKLNFVDRQLQQDSGRLRISETDLAFLKANEKCMKDEIKELKTTLDGRAVEDEEVTKLKSVLDKLILERDEATKEKAQLTQEVSQLRSEMKELSDQSGAATYIRWGRTTCPTGNDVIYKGFAAGNSYGNKPGTANMLCLSEEPIYANYSEKAGENYRSSLYGTEYETVGDPAFARLNDKEMSCVVCGSQSKRSSVMVPGRNKCFPGWTLEYWGYLMGPYSNHASTQYICVDTDAEEIGSVTNLNGNVMYLVESICGSLKCPPYKNGWELSCAVCSR